MTFAAMVLAGTMLVRSPQVRAQNNNQGNDAARIQQGLAIAPVSLNLAGKDPALVGLGNYIVNAQVDCNGCHTLNNGSSLRQQGTHICFRHQVDPSSAKRQWTRRITWQEATTLVHSQVARVVLSTSTRAT